LVGRRFPQARVDPRFALITAAILGVVLYGSLYPFHFVNPPHGRGAFLTLIESWRDAEPRTDVIANILLYAPLGFFAVQSLRGRTAPMRIALVACAGLALSAGIELLQYFDLQRVTNMSDVYSNTAGTLLGAFGGTLLHREVQFPLIGHIARRRFVVLLLVSWLGSRLFPYLLRPNFGESWGRLFVISGPRIAALDLYIQFAIWLVVALLIEALVGQDRGRWALLWVFPALLFIRTLLAGRGPSASEALGGVLAAFIWSVLLCRLRARASLVATLFAGVVVLQGLAPYTFLSKPRHFGMVPFLSFINDTRDNGVRSFFDKTFTYGGLVWLTIRAGSSWTIAVISGGILVLALRLAQVYLPGRTAEITDLLMLLILAAMLRLMREDVPAG
jgi:VanZ family protein